MTLLAAPSSSAEDLQSKLEEKEAEALRRAREEGRADDDDQPLRRADRPSDRRGRLAANRGGRGRGRLAAKQAELDSAVDELDTARRHLALVKARLQPGPRRPPRPAGRDLRERLPRRPQRHPRLRGLRRDGQPHRVPRTDPGHGRGGRRPRPRTSRSGQGHRQQAAHRQGHGSKPHETRSPPKSRQLVSARQAVQDRQSALVSVRCRTNGSASKRSAATRTSSTATSPISRLKSPQRSAGYGSRRSGRPDQAGLGRRLDLAGQRRPSSPASECAGAGPTTGRRHRRPRRDPDPGRGLGTVVLLQGEAESGGYGNFTCLDHGGGLSTCYAHQSSFAVSSGQSVSQGDVIGYVGCTGHCFGDHLHFEVRINGEPTDPMGYL